MRDTGHARQRRADRVEPTALDVRQIPDGGRTGAEVRVVGQQRLPRRRPRPGDHPVVARAEGVEGVWRRRQQLRGAGDRVEDAGADHAGRGGLRLRDIKRRKPLGEDNQTAVYAGIRALAPSMPTRPAMRARNASSRKFDDRLSAITFDQARASSAV